MTYFRNRVGDGERPVINVPAFDQQPELTREDLSQFLEQDARELRTLEDRGIPLGELKNFMKRLLRQGYERMSGELVDGMYREEMSRKALEDPRMMWYELGIWNCPFSECDRAYRTNRDVYFDSQSNGKGFGVVVESAPVEHPAFRLNDLSIHLAVDHRLFQKGENARDQCYPTSPLQFAEQIYLPWKEKFVPPQRSRLGRILIPFSEAIEDGMCIAKKPKGTRF